MYIVKLIFFDESKENSDHRHYHIGAIGIDESDIHDVETMLNRISNDVFGSPLLTKLTEFHATSIFHRKHNFSTWSDPAKRLEVMKLLLEVLSTPEVQLIEIQVNLEPLYANKKPEDIAFMFLCERANDLCEYESKLGLLIGDRDSDFLSEKFAVTLSQYRATSTEFHSARKLNNLVDSVHFTHSHLSRFLQLADVYTWILRFMKSKRKENYMNDEMHTLIYKRDYDLSSSKYKIWPTET